MKTKLLLTLIIVLSMFCLTGCYNAEGLETLAYAVALGIDKGESNKMRLSLQIAQLTTPSGSGGRKQSISKFYYKYY